MLYGKYFLRQNFLGFIYEKLKLNFFRFFLILSRINEGVYLSLLEHANTRKHVYEHSCSCVGAFLSILAHLAHLAHSVFLI